VERNFLAISASMAARKGKIPPMHVPVDHLTYAQTGAGTGLRLSPFYKVPVQHNGLDLVGGQGEPVYAAAAGTVSEVTHSGKGLGNVVTIDHGGGCTTRYAHLADILVSKGQKVSRGRKIASVGISGNSFAPHLHYEVLQDGVPQDPVNYFFASLSPGDYADVVYMSVSTEQSLD
jgi:murein DD-endopeptidase MepM/ murein hydrolase activator NlpD